MSADVERTGREREAGGLWLLVALPAIKLLIHLLTIPGYGYFRDELYYLACADHLDWGYVDQPPLSILLLWMVRGLLGDSLWAVRLLPALAGAATVLLVGLSARALGGGRFAMALGMLAAIVAPMYLALNHYYSMNSFDLLLWALAAYLLIHLLEGGDRRLWLVLGVVLGLGLLNKISVLWLGFGLAVGLLATSRRRDLLTPWPWACGALALGLFLPHLAWQMVHGFPTLEFIERATSVKMAGVSLPGFFAGQVRAMNPVTLPVWLGGLAWLLFSGSGHRFRLLGWTWLAVFLLLGLSGTSRESYPAPSYTWLFAAGGVAVAGWIERIGWAWLRPAVLATVAAWGLLVAPFGLPVLPVPTYVSYAASLGVGPSTEERKEVAELPQFYADMHGWREIVDTLARVYRSLPPEEQAVAAIFTGNYGEAGAVDLFGRELGLPHAVSGHNSYWLWGPGRFTGEVVIVLGSSEERMRESFARVERAATTDCHLCMPYEDGQPVWIGRDLRVPLAEAWPGLKHFD